MPAYKLCPHRSCNMNARGVCLLDMNEPERRLASAKRMRRYILAMGLLTVLGVLASALAAYLIITEWPL